MSTIRTFAHYLMTTISLVTALGVFTHDSRVDKAATTALSQPVVTNYVATHSVLARYTDFMSSDAHTHPDHNTGKSLLSSFFYQSPSVAPRRKSHRKELARLTAEPRHAFDNANLPILE